MRTSSLAMRLTGTALLASLVALVAAGFVISSLLRSFVEDTYSTNLEVRMLGLMASIDYDESTNRPILLNSAPDPRFEQPFSGWYWTIADGSTILFRSGSLWSYDLDFTHDATGPRGEALLTAARSFTVPGGTSRLTVTATAPRSEIDAEIGTVVYPLVMALSVLGLSLALAQLIQVRIGLRPLLRLGTNLARVQHGDLERLPKEYYRELAPVIDQMNGLIDSNHETLRRTREHVGNLAHALKTPLAVAQSELSRVRDNDEAVAGTREALASMDRQIGHRLRRARAAGATAGLMRTRTAVFAVIEDLLPVFRGVHADRNLRFECKVPKELSFAGDRHDLEEVLGNLMDNACKWAASSVLISAIRREDNTLQVEVSDDGNGLSELELARAGQRGLRFDETRPGTGLGISIVREIVGVYGGELVLSKAKAGGLSAKVLLPAAMPMAEDLRVFVATVV